MTDDAARRLDALGKELHLQFPEGSRLLGIERAAGLDDVVRAKVVMPKANWEAFRAAVPLSADEMDPGENGLLGQDHGFWDPHSAADIRTGQVNRPGARVLNIGVAIGPSPESVSVYVVEHGM